LQLRIITITSILYLARFKHCETINMRRKQKMTDTITTENTQIIPNNSSTRRLIIITGDKGGVGKSTFARGLAQVYLDNHTKFVGFDADISNSQLERFYGERCKIEKLNIFKDGGIDGFFNNINTLINKKKTEEGQEQTKGSLFLLELPPQSRTILQNFVEDMTFLETARLDYDIRVTMVVVISRISDSVNQLIHLHSFCKDMADYVIVKNLHFGEENEFTLYKESTEIQSIKNTLQKSNASFVEINMPSLIAHAYQYLDKNNMTFEEGIAQTENPAVKGRTRGWMKKFKEEIAPAKELLGLGGVNF